MEFGYLNFYSFGSILAALFCLYVAFFFLRIKERSQAALHLGIASCFAFFFHFGYTIGFFTLERWGIYHRWIVIPSALLVFAQFSLVFFYFPTPRKEKIGKYIYFFLVLIVVVVEILFILNSRNSVGRFVKGSHYWDFETYSFYMIYSVLVLFFNLLCVFLGIWRALSEKGKERKAVIYMLFAFCIILVIPAVTNALNRNGSISRIVYQQAVDLSFVIGFFLLLVIYLNIAKEKTTILNRIVGISMATFFLVFQIIAYFILIEYELAFDRIQYQEAKLSVATQEKAKGLEYVVSYDISTRSSNQVFGKSDPISESARRLEANYMHLWNSLNDLEDLPANERLLKTESLLIDSPPEFFAYKAAILGFLSSRENKAVSNIEMETFLKRLSQRMIVLNSQFAHVQDKKDLVRISKLFSSSEPGVTEMLNELSITYGRELQAGASDDDLRRLVFNSTLPIYREGERMYRGADSSSMAQESKPFRYYVAYYLVNKTSGRLFEAGFDYRIYRAYLHYPSLILLLCLISIMFLVVFGFELFFKYALIIPMKEVVSGLQEVYAGNLEYRLVPKVEDEIGFIARSFNHMAESMLSARNSLRNYAENLELKVKERTNELEITLNEVKVLKEQQDGDYFLMSLLLKSLAANRANHGNVKVDLLTDQKKKFKFRNYDSEIGGDISASNRIQLRGKNYTVFLNADAMGKSMQGAGGALVFGAVFEAIIERTKITDSIRDYSPERWLKSTFMELHKVFLSFNGSMLVSAVIGLVDEETGILYHLNAEHPWTVLYRNDQAGFIENDLTFRKLGTEGMNGRVYVKTFQLLPGDVIIAGSDGRDDIHIGLNEAGEKLINDDHTRFLAFVQSGRGNLESIFHLILSEGHLTDDLSLIRISFKEKAIKETNEDTKEIQDDERVLNLIGKAKRNAQDENFDEAISLFRQIETLNGKIPITKKYLAFLFMRKKLFGEAAYHAEEYLKLHPLDNEMLYFASFMLRKSGKIERAADLGERLRLREPNHVKNLLNLSRIYLVLKKYDSALAIAMEAFELDSKNERIAKLLDLLKSLGKERTHKDS
ncbi:SpoIIE-like protein phosphatase domain protein [Leptospira broomii serovar Hurstbridge str. 5399]|uniref:SpoIIE-like protein phosphatase domain protein n=1 Tax=Leptospira broomii serovar Hurstbridge str. 5399 TaxID=1049789 RepID=T0GAH1_9LEPT|nr:SpoIIE family protein phosphatase [Leptospira broomii]EQA43829.1 SpoIIE-like protein phosphatase domain protein [Leptospira broomii serovar Hurstbridge str. 5399]